MTASHKFQPLDEQFPTEINSYDGRGLGRKSLPHQRNYLANQDQLTPYYVLMSPCADSYGILLISRTAFGLLVNSIPKTATFRCKVYWSVFQQIWYFNGMRYSSGVTMKGIELRYHLLYADPLHS